jgi:hypothetical protein
MAKLDGIPRDFGKIYRLLLDDIFKKAQTDGVQLSPCEGMQRLTRTVKNLIGSDESEYESETDAQTERAGLRAWRNAYHYSVDCFFRTYGGVSPGRPRIPQEVLAIVTQLKKQGLSHSKLGRKLGITADAARKRLKSAQKMSRLPS